MQRAEILAVIDEEISTLQRVRDLLESSTPSKGLKALKAKASAAPRRRKRRVMSAEARERIGLAQKRRWAKQRKEAVSAEKK